MAVKIAVIDSGIDTSIADLKKYVSHTIGYCLDDTGRVIEQREVQSRHSHATVISLIIRSICRDVELISINILDENLKSDGRVLLFAFNEALNLNVDIVHLSLGTRKKRYIPGLCRIIRKAVKRNMIVIAAVSNENKRCYPAFLKNVWKVRSLLIVPFSGFIYKKGFFMASYSAEQINGVDKVENKGTSGNSIAAAYITGHAAKLIFRLKSINRKKLGKMMRQEAAMTLSEISRFPGSFE